MQEWERAPFDEGDDWDPGWESDPPWFPTTPGDLGEPDLELLELLNELLESIDRRLADVLRRRLGLTGEGRQTLREIGREYGLSYERIRQLEQNGIKRLRGAAQDPHGVGASLPHRLRTITHSLRKADRGLYLQSSFPEANEGSLGRLVSALIGGDAGEVSGWIETYEHEKARLDQTFRAQHRLSRQWDRFVRGAVWPGSCSDCLWGDGFEPCRTVGAEGGEVWSPKMGRTVQYESSLEAHLIQVFEHAPEVAEYCEQPLTITYSWFDGPRTYVPDFAIRLNDGRALLVEAKPMALWADGRNLAKWNAATRWCAVNRWGLVVSDGRGRYPTDLATSAEPDDFELLEELTSGGLADWPVLRSRWFESGRNWQRLLAASYAYGFAVQRSPLQVRRARNSPWLTAVRGAIGSP